MEEKNQNSDDIYVTFPEIGGLHLMAFEFALIQLDIVGPKILLDPNTPQKNKDLLIMFYAQVELLRNDFRKTYKEIGIEIPDLSGK